MKSSAKSSLIKRSMIVAGRKTSVSLEDYFWDALGKIAKEREQSLPKLVTSINASRKAPNLTSAIRVFVVDYLSRRKI